MRLDYFDGVERRTIVPRLPAGDAGIVRTVEEMRRIARAGGPHVDWVAVQVRTNVVFSAWLAEWIRGAQVFAADPDGVELLMSPEWLISQWMALGRFACDCDDVAILGAAVLLAAGYRPVIIVVSRVAESEGGQYEHVFYGHRVPGSEGPPVMENVVPWDPQERRFMGSWRGADLAILNRMRIFDV